MRHILRFAGSLAVGWLLCDISSTSAHDLPISNMMIVAAEDTMHVELVLNAAELSFFSEIDRDKNGLIDPEETKAQSDQISQRIVECFTFQIAGKPVTAAVHGVVPDIGSHHLTIRAHYSGDARESPVHLKSHLAAITQRSHVIEVTFHRSDSRQAARLDAHDQEVLFDYMGKQDVMTASSELPDSGDTRRRDHVLIVGLAALLGSVFLFFGKKK